MFSYSDVAAKHLKSAEAKVKMELCLALLLILKISFK